MNWSLGIDIHTPTDEDIEKLPLARNYMQQGVTSTIGGNCGDSISESNVLA